MVIALFHVPFAWSLSSSAIMGNAFHLVDFFLVLSGFVMTHGFEARIGRDLSCRNFILDRLARIYPLHFFFLMVFLAYECTKLLVSYYGIQLTKPVFVDNNLATFISNLFLVHSMGLHDNYSYNVPSWTVSVEFVTYCLFGFALLTARSANTRILTAIAAVILSSVFLLMVPQKFMHATYDYGLFRGVYGFALGYLAYHLSIRLEAGGFKLPGASGFEFIALIAVSIFIVNVTDASPFAVTSSMLFALTMVVFSFDQGIFSKMLCARGFQSIGNWSYPIYLGHFLIISLIGIVIRHGMGYPDILKLPAEAGNYFIIVYVMGTVSLAALLHVKFEMPAKHWAYPRMKKLGDLVEDQLSLLRPRIKPIPVAAMAIILTYALLLAGQAIGTSHHQSRNNIANTGGVYLDAWSATYLDRPSPLAQRMHERAEGSSSSRF